MNNAPILYNLYCLNFLCRFSIFEKASEVKVVFNEKNLLATHKCGCCGLSLVSAMDLEIEKLVTETGVKLIAK